MGLTRFKINWDGRQVVLHSTVLQIFLSMQAWFYIFNLNTVTKRSNFAMSHNPHNGFIRAPANCCLFVCLEFFVPFENFSHICRRHHCRWRTANFDLCSALMATEQWGFFSVPHLLWHGASVYNGHLWEPEIFIPNAEHLAVELSILVLRVRSVAAGIRSPNPPLAGRTLLEPQWHRNIYDLGCFNLTSWKDRG